MPGGVWDSPWHAPVLVDEVVGLFDCRGSILDCTLGGGGHTAALLAAGASVIGIDRDEAAITVARDRLAEYESAGRFGVILGNFAEADRLLPDPSQKFDGILADLGVSSHQIDDAARGFSFREGVPLDMRMQTSAGHTAADLLNTLPEEDLAGIFRSYGDERRPRKLAREITRRRATRAFATSDDLVGAIRAVLGARSGPGDFARVFQAMRIAVNDELRSLESALSMLRERLSPRGVLAMISYHSGEDRLVKHAFREWSMNCICPPRQFTCNCRGRALGEVITRKPIAAPNHEVEQNPRARSARLRAWRREG